MDNLAYQQLLAYYKNIKDTKLLTLFKNDSTRVKHFSIVTEHILYDFSRNHLTGSGKKYLVEYAKSVNLKQKIEDLFLGNNINFTQNKPALHTALRDFTESTIIVNEKNLIDEFRQVHQKMRNLTQKIHCHKISSNKITDVICLGIGGSFLGPYLVCDALSANITPKLNIHFLSHLNSRKVNELKEKLSPKNTLVCISSKSFSTQETMLHANEFSSWYKQSSEIENKFQHFIALTSNVKKALAFGVLKENILLVSDFVGGRFSVWSAIGLPIALSFGFNVFMQLLEGAQSMDAHFRNTPFEKNIPVMQALLDMWYANFFNAKTRAILPYDTELNNIVPYIQQLAMESNGKSVNIDSKQIKYSTTPVFWGENGGDSQHAFNQMLFQGTQSIPADFIVCLKKANQIQELQDALIANCISQASALMQGVTEPEDAKIFSHKCVPGNQASNLIILKSLHAKSLGALMAMLEHRIFAASVLWRVNAFDQWGVELGKTLYPNVLAALTTQLETSDSSYIDIFQLLPLIKSKK